MYLRCPDCEAEKPAEDFPLNAARPNGRGVYCKECHAERSRRWVANNPTKRQKAVADYAARRKALEERLRDEREAAAKPATQRVVKGFV